MSSLAARYMLRKYGIEKYSFIDLVGAFLDACIGRFFRQR